MNGMNGMVGGDFKDEKYGPGSGMGAGGMVCRFVQALQSHSRAPALSH